MHNGQASTPGRTHLTGPGIARKSVTVDSQDMLSDRLQPGRIWTVTAQHLQGMTSVTTPTEHISSEIALKIVFAPSHSLLEQQTALQSVSSRDNIAVHTCRNPKPIAAKQPGVAV